MWFFFVQSSNSDFKTAYLKLESIKLLYKVSQTIFSLKFIIWSVENEVTCPFSIPWKFILWLTNAILYFGGLFHKVRKENVFFLNTILLEMLREAKRGSASWFFVHVACALSFAPKRNGRDQRVVTLSWRLLPARSYLSRLVSVGRLRYEDRVGNDRLLDHVSNRLVFIFVSFFYLKSSSFHILLLLLLLLLYVKWDLDFFFWLDISPKYHFIHFHLRRFAEDRKVSVLHVLYPFLFSVMNVFWRNIGLFFLFFYRPVILSLSLPFLSLLFNLKLYRILLCAFCPVIPVYSSVIITLISRSNRWTTIGGP